jgi:hypothetical protein
MSLHRSLRTRVVLASLTAGCLSVPVFAHHLPRPLSHLRGKEVLDQVAYYQTQTSTGVPAYATGTIELDHHEQIAVSDGDGFTVTTANGGSESVRLTAADFTDISNVELPELLAVINSKTTLLQAAEINAFAVVRGFVGGVSDPLTLQDGPGTPLAKLGLADGVFVGDQDLRLEVSLPGDHEEPEEDHGGGEGLADHPFVVLLSRVDGSFTLDGQEIPLGIDPLNWRLDGTGQAVLSRGVWALRPGTSWPVSGVLDENEDAAAVIYKSDLDRVLGRVWPDRIFIAVAVLSMDRQHIEYVTNRFTVNVIK